MLNLSKSVYLLVATAAVCLCLAACSILPEGNEGVPVVDEASRSAQNLFEPDPFADQPAGSEQDPPKETYVSVHAPRSLWDINFEVVRQNDGRHQVSSMTGVSSPHTPPIDGRTAEIRNAFPSESFRDLTQVDPNCWPEMNGNWYPGFSDPRTNRFSFWLRNGDGAENSELLLDVELELGDGTQTEIRPRGEKKACL